MIPMFQGRCTAMKTLNDKTLFYGQNFFYVVFV